MSPVNIGITTSETALWLPMPVSLCW